MWAIIVDHATTLSERFLLKRPRPSDQHLDAWRALLQTHAAVVRRINASLEAAGALGLESYDVLLELYEAPDKKLRLNDLGERVVLTRSGISRLVSRLERDGLVQRESVEGDGRGVYARLTRTGERRFKRTWPLYAQAIQEHFARHLERREAESVASLLNRVRDENE